MTMRNRHVRRDGSYQRVISVATALLVFVALATAQTPRAVGLVTVLTTDDQGAIVPGSQVTVENLRTGSRHVATTGECGLAQTPGLVASTYRVQVVATGFKVQTIKSVRLRRGEHRVLAFVLVPAYKSETVRVDE